ncbi:MAG: sigma-70 family RNA polymerase sigma factor [Sterolibacteriaceae bacterium MAG5]|nr:sigma-70 family RNA polymerase sigma factor [Candidatus Nitricoxidireducens bremensis]
MQTVYIVEDDPAVRDALALLLGIEGYAVAMYADAESMLGAYRPEWRGCLLIDIRMPGMNGLALQRRLIELGCRMPVIIMTGHGDVASAREAFRAQAIEFLEKPVDQGKLIGAIEEAFARLTAVAGEEEQRAELEHKLASLTPREREVMDLVVAGRHNREIAQLLGISARTVEVHKARMMTKLQADSVSQLVRISLGLGG